MNIFFLHFDVQICAMWHLDKHVIKQILETVQLLCSVWHMSDETTDKIYKPPYKLTHKNHPCSKWARESLDNYKWLCVFGLELCKEYTYRYGKTHKCEQYLNELSKYNPSIPSIGFTPPAQAMPDSYKDKDPTIAYQQYYFFEKSHLHSWKGKINGRHKPLWISELEKMFS